MTVALFAEAVRAYSGLTTASVTSWGRTTKRNALVGGRPRSKHLDWLAVDVVYDTKPGLVEANDLAARHGLRLIREGTHDHLQPKITGG
jgi:hypothetical protein